MYEHAQQNSNVFLKHEIHHCEKLLWCLLVILLSLGGRRGMVWYYLRAVQSNFRISTNYFRLFKCSRRWKLNRFCTARFYNNCIIAPSFAVTTYVRIKLNWIWHNDTFSCLKIVKNFRLHSESLIFNWKVSCMMDMIIFDFGLSLTT